MKDIIVAFDFDGTITKGDTFLDFAFHAVPKIRFMLGLILYSPVLGLFLLGVIPGGWVKQKLFSFYYRGWTKEEYKEKTAKYWNQYFSVKVRAKAIDSINKFKTAGQTVVIVSASPDLFLNIFASRLGIDSKYVIGTKIEVVDGILTGFFCGDNCKGKEKVRRLIKVFPNREEYHLIAYGDSKGDKDLLDFADDSYYKFFT